MSARVLTGDCLAVMPTLDAESVDAIVCDPPYGLGFMGKAWDHGVPGVPFWEAALRVAKPGAHLVAFGGTRTYHRLTVAIEDAGWEIRDCLSWLYGSGFPKSLDVSKAIDGSERGQMVRTKLLHFVGTRGIDGAWLEAQGVASAASFRDWTIGGHVPGEKNWRLVKDALGVTADEEAAYEREVVARGHRKNDRDATSLKLGRVSDDYDITAPATDAAKQWQGWGTALKPAWEPIILARKPLVGTVAANVTAHGTGALNIDGCRIAGEPWTAHRATGLASAKFFTEGEAKDIDKAPHDGGRWPPNVCLDEDAARVLDEQSGTLAARGNVGPSVATGAALYGPSRRNSGADYPSDSGGASRFFYTAKASRSERNAGVEKNHHPTVKPLDLMRWLCRLVTPKGGLILDPFTGSGSTGRAAIAEGFRFLGIELSEEYAEIARARIREYAPLFADGAA